MITIVISPSHLLGAEVIRRVTDTTSFQTPMTFLHLDRMVDGGNISVAEEDVRTAQIDPAARDAYAAALAEVNRDAGHLADLCQDAHDTLTRLGAPGEGTPAKRIEGLYA